MTGLRIALFGAFVVSDLADRPVQVRARKNRALLAILASAPGKRFSREGLANLLWESRGDEQARASLRQALSALRRDLGALADVLEADTEAVWLVPERLEVDLVRLRALVESPDPDAACLAAPLVAGPFLDGLELREEAFREWLRHERQRAHSLATRALRRSAFEQGPSDPEAAISDLVRWIELEPENESAHRELMRTYAAAGRTAEALQHYERLRRMLETELSARPAAETERLAAGLRRERPQADAHAAAPSTETDAAEDVRSAADTRAGEPGIRYAVVLCGRLDLPESGDAREESEDLYTASGNLLAEVEAIVECHGGRFHRRSGTRFLGVFGLEQARGSEAERAARSALDLQERQAELQPRAGCGVMLHCAITAGRVIAEVADRGTNAAGRIAGQPVDWAERLESRAPAGTVLIDRPARRLLEERADLVVESVKTLDGEPIWRLDSLEHRTGPARQTPFVGRTYELSEIERAAKGTRREQCAHVVLLRGEAGIGKTRLLNEAASRGQALGFEWHASTILDFGVAEGEDAIAILVRSLLGLSGPEQKPDVDALTAEGILVPDQEPFLLDLLDIPQPPRMRAIYSAMDTDTRRRGQASVVAHLVTERCRHTPLLISIEDLHWADAATLWMLAELARRTADAAVVMILTTRIEGDPIDRAWHASTRGIRMLTLDLVPLREVDAKELGTRFGGVPDDVIEACVSRAEGNPLFLVQLLLAARDPASEQVPATIQSLVQTRLDALEPDVRRILQIAAVLGQRFTTEDLEALLEDRPDYDRLLDSYLVQPQGEGYAFSHALVREGIHGSMLRMRQRQLHARAAQWFSGRDPVLHALHLDSAEDPAAPAAYLEAARQQSAAFRYERAIELLERGLTLSNDSDERSRLLMTKGEVLTDSGQAHDAIAVLHEAEREATDPAVRCRVLIDIAAAMRITDQIDEAFRLLEQAEPLAKASELNIELARLCQLRGSLHFPRGRIRECFESQERACHYAEAAGSPELEALALGGLSDAYYALGYLLRAKDAYVRCVQLAEEHGLGRVAVANMPMIGDLHKYLMDLDSGLRVSRRAIEFARTVGHHRAELLAHNSVAFHLMETGAAEEMLRHVDSTEPLISRLESKRFVPRALYYRAKAHVLLGEPARARELLEQAHRLCREGDIGFVGPSVCAALALASEDRERRRHLLREAREILDRGALPHNTVDYHRDAMEVALDEDDAGTALALADAFEAAMSHEPTPFTDCLIERARLLARWTEGPRSTETRDALQLLSQRLRQASFNTLSVRIDDALADA